MWKTIGQTIVTVLATLGVVFIVMMLLPDDEEDTQVTVSDQSVATVQANDTVQATAEVQTNETSQAAPATQINETEQPVATAQEEAEQSATAAQAEEVADTSETATQAQVTETEASEPEAQTETAETQVTATGNTVTVSIPASELSDKKFRFTSSLLDGSKVDQDIFSGYDLTLVLIWATYCTTCIDEMEDYEALYRSLPDNVNMITIVGDTYYGIDSNVSAAESILRDAGADFKNMRTSDDLYVVMQSVQVLPSAFFVDGEGHVAGELMSGPTYSMVKDRLEGYYA